MKVARLACVALLLAISGCTSNPPVTPTSPPAGVKPSPPTIEVAGELETSHESGGSITYFLKDGRQWSKPTADFRVAYDMASDRTLLVAGSDTKGEFVALVGSQPGLPAGCTFALRYDGVDWGDSIESQGLLWRKRPDFSAGQAAPTAGQAYPNATVFCLDAMAQVQAAIQVGPPSQPQPAGSAAT
jgi:hypothetical protein